ncbi:hypothetical protein A1Q1_00837 [Trichosporon asahii var. asahii CBS 2479]|uniref:Cytochrome c oxidase assembly protein COX20, mitochondrial n=1 Tax=Trichosporon asahii var. asahii (strain ATCC 90039 / CBS 2479 / JCM 2466 / KCTC 7840 / NBRC 103889/ NCYC 2677 / UAMH 7654) TaxID=1186058 RepID=J5TAQ4_TRIAS|nr:hypothetical protein A1Q1_00837 [Trichosporon asahii var. asahii CBS 2479]EJT49996.1 hypothetical protein A1Q1_00837 [Trichosporon asahii var. asahii CBS 2479]
MSDNDTRRPENEPKPILNIPAGNSPITPDSAPGVLPPDERRTGNIFKDSWTAIKVLYLLIPNADIDRGSDLSRTSRTSATSLVSSASNWAVFSFCAVSLGSWEVCQKQRREELAKQRIIQERFPHRHVSRLKKKGEEYEAPSPSATEQK